MTTGKVVAIPGHARPEDALKVLNAVLADEAAPARGLILVVIDHEGDAEAHLFGETRRYDFSYVGALLTDFAVNGDFEAA